MMANSCYFLDYDDDGYWYIIPVDFRDRWIDWLDMGCPDSPPPFFADRLKGHPNQVEFENPKGERMPKG